MTLLRAPDFLRIKSISAILVWKTARSRLAAFFWRERSRYSIPCGRNHDNDKRILLDKCGLLFYIFSGVLYDSKHVSLILTTIKTYLPENTNISKTMKLHAFSTLIVLNPEINTIIWYIQFFRIWRSLGNIRNHQIWSLR